MRKKIIRILSSILFLTIIMTAMPMEAFASIWTFGTTGQGNNPFTPRGYLVDTGTGQTWLRSGFDNSGPVIQYTGAINGTGFIAAANPDGSNYTFYAMTDRNPSPEKTRLLAWKDGVEIPGFGNYTGTPRRGDQIDPSKETTCWIIPIENFSLEPGCMYEFGFRRGMIANNGISLVLAEDNTGYLKQPFTGEEQARYDQYKEEEYKFVASRDGTNLNLVPMRFTVQTYADLSIWSEAEAEAVNFLSTVTEADLDKGRYNRENVEALRGHLSSLQAQVETGAKMELQGQSNITQKRLAQELRATLAQAKVEKPIEADLTALTAKIKEAKEFYEKAKKNVGIELGQYGEEAVNALNTEIGVAQAMHKFTRQEEIDAEIVNLESAMIRVKSSVVREPYVTFRDKATGLVVIAPIAAFPANAQMIVRRANQASEAYKNAVKNLSKEETEATLYIIEFYSGINLVQPEKEITIQIPTEEKMKNFLTTLYFADAKGKLEEIKAPEINGMKMFTDNKVGTYLVSGREKPKTEEKDQKTETMTIMREDPLPKEPEEKETEIEKEKEKKEEIVNPIDEYRKKVENDAKFDHNAVTRDASPVYLLVVAMILAVAAVGVGARAMLKGRKKDD